jgi:hypothetical protein
MRTPKTYRDRGEEPKKNRSIKIEETLYVQFQSHAEKLGLGFSSWAVNALLDRMNQDRLDFKLSERMKKR